MPIGTVWHVLLRAVQDWWQDNCLRLAASLAYYTALSLAPLVLLIVGVVGLVLERQQVAQQLTAQLEGLMGPAGRDLITTILTTTSPHGGALATLVGVVTLFIGATAVFGELQATLNLIWDVQPAPTGGVWAGIWAWLRQRLFSLALVFALAFLLLVSLVISAALASAAALFHGPEQGRALAGRAPRRRAGVGGAVYDAAAGGPPRHVGRPLTRRGQRGPCGPRCGQPLRRRPTSMTSGRGHAPAPTTAPP
jgi:uncharacterized BrkB/YihY/UPF0761 family membrane protein